MNTGKLVIGGVALVVGVLLGHSANKSYLDGRLSACEDFVSALNRAPGVDLRCSKEDKDVYIVSDANSDIRFNLRGESVTR